MKLSKSSVLFLIKNENRLPHLWACLRGLWKGRNDRSHRAYTRRESSRQILWWTAKCPQRCNAGRLASHLLSIRKRHLCGWLPDVSLSLHADRATGHDERRKASARIGRARYV